MRRTDISEEIRRRGFRRWYEPQWIESHAYLVTAFLSLILLLAGFEAMDALRGSPAYYVAVVGVAAAAGVVMWGAWRRFTVVLARMHLILSCKSEPGPGCSISYAGSGGV